MAEHRFARECGKRAEVLWRGELLARRWQRDTLGWRNNRHAPVKQADRVDVTGFAVERRVKLIAIIGDEGDRDQRSRRPERDRLQGD